MKTSDPWNEDGFLGLQRHRVFDQETDDEFLQNSQYLRILDQG